VASDPVYCQATVEFCEWLTESFDHFHKRFRLATTPYLNKLHNGEKWYNTMSGVPPLRLLWVTPTGVSLLHRAFKLWNKHIRGNPVAPRAQEHEIIVVLLERQFVRGGPESKPTW
jgi:hypothetical protein